MIELIEQTQFYAVLLQHEWNFKNYFVPGLCCRATRTIATVDSLETSQPEQQ